jgi:hypothetical protein
VKALHAILVVVAFVPWLIGCIGFGAALALVLLADRIWPGATRGNCWSYVGPRWWRRGGYLLIRWAAGWPMIPHAAWVRELSADNALEQTVPLERVTRWSLWWKTLYFPFRVSSVEQPRNAREFRE